jgi:hypothetical protein
VRRLAGAGALALVVASVVAFATAEPAAAATRVRRVLVLSLPHVEWSDVQRADTPNLRRLLRESAVGSLMTNGVLRPSPLGDGYLTLGAGARATGDPLLTGQGFGVDEQFGDDVAGNVFASRTGVVPGGGLVYMPIATVVQANAAERFDAHVGRLGDALAGAHVSRAVIANGDGTDPSTPERLYPAERRAAVAALTTSDGTVPGGAVDRSLLVNDDRAPFGLRLDRDAVLRAFTDAWRGRAVVLVEGSDLVRADVEGQFASAEASARMREHALRDTDRIIGGLLEHVDPQRDAVVVVGPAPPTPDIGLTVAAVRAPGFGRGLLRSDTTRRAGYVNLADVAPTVLHLLGIDRPHSMEGRAMESVTTGASSSVSARLDQFTRDAVNSRFRDDQAGIAVGVLFGIATLLALVTVVAGLLRSTRWRGGARFTALWLLGFLVAAALAAPLHFAEHGGAAPFWTFVVGIATLLAVADTVVGRRLGHPADALLAALGTLLTLHVVDVVTGAHLELDSVFGYSPTTDWRVGHLGDLAFAQLAAAAILLAGLLAWRVPGRVGARIAVAVLAITAVVVGVPAFGDDFAGMVVVVVAFGALAWRLLGRPVRAFAAGTALIVFLAAMALVAVARSGTSEALDDARHTVAVNVPLFTHSALVGMVIVVAVLLACLWHLPPRPLREVVQIVPTAGATAVAFLIVALVGFVLNDPGVSIPGMMAVVLESTVVFLVARNP